jgi:uncharacterized protein
MAGHGSQIRRWAVLLVLFAVATPAGTQAQTAANDAAVPFSPNGTYLHSRLMPPKPEGACPPDIDPMYRASTIVTGTDMRQRPWGFARTLREVLVKASGDPRLKEDPRTAPLAERAEESVACFRYADMMAGVPLHDDQGTYDRPHELTVYFDPAKIDAALAQLGDKPWRGVRPVLVPVLLVRGRKPPTYLLSAETPEAEEQRGAFGNAAGEFGLQARIPSEAQLRAWGARAGNLPKRPRPSSASQAIVLGTLDWSENLPGWVGKWRMHWRGADYAWGISGVNYDAAFRNIARSVLLIASGAGPPDQGS